MPPTLRIIGDVVGDENNMEKIIMTYTRKSMEIKYRCGRCGWEWTSKKYPPEKGILPKRCPHCNSPYWNRQRTRKIRGKREDHSLSQMSDNQPDLSPAEIADFKASEREFARRKSRKKREENKA